MKKVRQVTNFFGWEAKQLSFEPRNFPSLEPTLLTSFLTFEGCALITLILPMRKLKHKRLRNLVK